MTREELKQISPKISDKAVETFLPYINKYAPEYQVTTRLRMAAFISELLHESGNLQFMRELATGDAYEGRADLGNNQQGDGRRFKGRGGMMITGRANYEEASKDMLGNSGVLINTPELLATPDLGIRSAYWFWNKKNLNGLADKGDYIKITKRINGGTNGIAERQAYYNAALTVLQIT